MTGLLEYFRRYRWHVAAWVAFVFAIDVVNALSVLQEYARRGDAIDPWEPFVWEFTSGIMILALIPAIIAFDRRFPLDFKRPFPSALPHLAGSLLFSAAHVSGFVALRKGVYAMAGGRYDFGHVPSEFLYEFRKDLLTYIIILAVIYAYREIRRLREGEAWLKGFPIEGAPKVVAAVGQRKLIIDPKDISTIESAGNYVEIRTQGKTYLARQTLSGIAGKLEALGFARVHRCRVVNPGFISEIVSQPNGGLILVMKDGLRTPASRRYRKNLKLETL